MVQKALQLIAPELETHYIYANRMMKLHMDKSVPESAAKQSVMR